MVLIVAPMVRVVALIVAWAAELLVGLVIPLLGLLVFSPTFCASFKILSFGKMIQDLVRYRCT